MTPKTILIVEDSLDLADTVHDLLTMHGYRAIIALNGKEAITLALEEHPDLILLDIHLPDISGYEVFQAIRHDKWGKTARVLVLTASESKENISKNISIPIEHILFKPNLSIPELIVIVEARLTE
jgi:DNA-binding response OmpR family regulator